MNSIQVQKPSKNKFDLSHEVKQTGNMGYLYPCYIQDVIPGDSFRVNTQQMIRFSPLLAPMMHNVDFKLDYFFVPYRLVWDEWKDFITGGEDGNDLPSHPRFYINGVTAQTLQKGSLADYMGIPPIESSMVGSQDGGAWTAVSNQSSQFLSLLPFRAYQLIYHEYFRDQNVGTEYTQHTDSGITSENTTKFTDQLDLRRSNWEKDYFTSSLPFLQRGGEVELPLGTVTVDSFRNPDGSLGASGDLKVLGATTTPVVTPGGQLYLDPADGSANVYGSLEGEMTAVTINELRKASALQKWLEIMARAGSRYREQIFAIFGERIPDYTVQVPQYLGGGKTPIMISEVLSTYANEGSSDRPQGDMSGHALGLGDGIGFQQSFDEHGIVLGLCRIIPKASYVQGLSRFWQKFDKFDHYFPQFANLGEQEVYNKELFIKGDRTTDDQIFGYQQRYAEYKYAQNRIAGDFRDTLAHWELSRRFNDYPLLNQSFIECNDSETSRIFAIEDSQEDKIWISLYHKVDALRPMPYHSNPTLS